MQEIVLASRNDNKIREFNEMFVDTGIKLISLDDIGFVGDIDETGTTCEENAKIKAQTVVNFMKSQNLNLPVIADDSGLFVNALNGAPGVYSARYAGEHNNEANRKKLLNALLDVSDRTAYFKCVLCYIHENKIKFFEGRVNGEITTKEIGQSGFGYDCLFYSPELKKTFAEATKEEKDKVSHRGRAVELLKQWLTNIK